MSIAHFQDLTRRESEQQSGIDRIGEEDFTRLYSASSRSLFHRGGVNCVLRPISTGSSPVGANQVVHSSSSAPIAETAYQFNTVLAGSRSATFQAAADQEILEWPLSFFRPRRSSRSAGNAVRRRHHSLPAGGIGTSDGARPNKSLSRCVGNASSRRSGNLTQLCGICQTDQPMDVLVPCGHMICSDCWGRCGQDNRCPFCRGAVESSIAIFKP